MKQQKWLDHVLLLLTKIVEQDLFFVSMFVIILNSFDDKKWLSYKEAVAFIIIVIIIITVVIFQIMNFVWFEVTTNYNYTQSVDL